MASIMEQVAAAKAAIPTISPQSAAELQAKGALIVDVRDAPELQASGKVKGAVHVSRGMLEFKADPKSPYHDPAFDPAKRGDPDLLGYADPRLLGLIAGGTAGGVALNQLLQLNGSQR